MNSAFEPGAMKVRWWLNSAFRFFSSTVIQFNWLYRFQVNHSPSFHTDAQLDKEIKEALIYDTMNLLNCGGVDKKKFIEEERKRIKDRLFNRGPGKKESK